MHSFRLTPSSKSDFPPIMNTSSIIWWFSFSKASSRLPTQITFFHPFVFIRRFISSYFSLDTITFILFQRKAFLRMNSNVFLPIITAFTPFFFCLSILQCVVISLKNFMLSGMYQGFVFLKPIPFLDVLEQIMWKCLFLSSILW